MQSILCQIFLMYVATMHCLNYSGQESEKQEIRSVIKPGMICQTPVQGYQYNHLSLKDLLYSVHKKANVIVFVKSENTSIISTEYIYAKVKKVQLYIHYLLDSPKNPTKFQLNWIRTYNFQLKLTLLCPSNKVRVSDNGMNR